MSHKTISKKRPLDRFLDRSIIWPNGCWIWVDNSNAKYGSFRDNKVLWSSHRWSYNHFIGEIPRGFLVHHKCDNRWCVNPYHLEAMSHADHQKLHLSRKTHCKHGHEFTKNNTKVYKNRSGRCCIACTKINLIKYKSIPSNIERGKAQAKERYWANRESCG